MNDRYNRKKSPYYILSAGIASVCLLTSAVPAPGAENAAAAASAAAVSAPAAIGSAPVNSPVTITPNNIEETNGLYEIGLSIPVITGMADTDAQNELNGTIKRIAMEDLAAVKSSAADGAAAAEEYGYAFSPYELHISYSIKSDGGEAAGGKLSLVVKTSGYTGGAHGWTRVDAYNVLNGDEASALTLDKLFGTGYAAIVNEAVKAKIAEEPESYFADAFQGVDGNQLFYVEGGSAYIVFQEYEIAPYAMGLVEVAVPLPDGEAAEVSKGAQWTVVTPDLDRYAHNRAAPISLGTAPELKDDTLYVLI